jgi:hypothetical protein
MDIDAEFVEANECIRRTAQFNRAGGASPLNRHGRSSTCDHRPGGQAGFLSMRRGARNGHGALGGGIA